MMLEVIFCVVMCLWIIFHIWLKYAICRRLDEHEKIISSLCKDMDDANLALKFTKWRLNDCFEALRKHEESQFAHVVATDIPCQNFYNEEEMKLGSKE